MSLLLLLPFDTSWLLDGATIRATAEVSRVLGDGCSVASRLSIIALALPAAVVVDGSAFVVEHRFLRLSDWPIASVFGGMGSPACLTLLLLLPESSGASFLVLVLAPSAASPAGADRRLRPRLLDLPPSFFFLLVVVARMGWAMAWTQ